MDTTASTQARPNTSCSGLCRGLRDRVVDYDTVSVIDAKRPVSWHTTHSAVLDEGPNRLINDLTRFDRISVVGVD